MISPTVGQRWYWKYTSLNAISETVIELIKKYTVKKLTFFDVRTIYLVKNDLKSCKFGSIYCVEESRFSKGELKDYFQYLQGQDKRVEI